MRSSPSGGPGSSPPGEALGGFSLTEPHAGSDATAITTAPSRTAKSWRVTGRKAWVSLAGEADLFLVVCKTSSRARPPRHRNRGRRARPPPACRSPCSTARRAPTSCRSARWSSTAPRAPPGAPRRRDARGPGRYRRRPCDIAAIAAGLHAEALDRAAVRRRAAGVRRAAPRPRGSGSRWLMWQRISEASRLLVPPGRRAAGDGGRARWPSRTPSGSAPTRPCVPRSRAARCSAPTAGCSTTRWRG